MSTARCEPKKKKKRKNGERTGVEEYVKDNKTLKCFAVWSKYHPKFPLVYEKL